MLTAVGQGAGRPEVPRDGESGQAADSAFTQLSDGCIDVVCVL